MDNTIRIAVVDDDESELHYIKRVIAHALQELHITCHIQGYQNATDMLQHQKDQPFNAVFLDIDMPDVNGMDAAEQLNQLEHGTEIVFVTNHDELVYKAYRFKALGFIRKKHMDEEIDEILEVLLTALNRKRKYLTFQDAGKTIRIRLEDIIFIQSDDHYAEVFTIHGKETIRESLNSIESAYGSLGLIRIHVRYLVNFKYIYSIEKNTVILQNRKQLPLSRSRSATVKTQFQMYARRV